MKKYIFLFIAALCVIENSYGAKSIVLSNPVTTSQTHVARDEISLKPGFSFSAAGGKEFWAYTNDRMLEPASYQSAPSVTNPYAPRTLNTNYAVGTIAGGASASPTGAAVYQIPIEVMPGTGGIQPNISVVYNSQSGNGLVGYGWSLGAVSAIVRTGKTLYHDGEIAVPQLTNSDNLMLDGQRLMRTSGTNLAASSTYRTEIEAHLDITCKTLNSYLGFEIKNKEGWIMEYGSSADSYIKPKDGSAAYAWLLKKVTDGNGNYMTYTYENDAATGELRLKQIDYTGNTAAGLNPYNKIEFFYETRTDKSTSYIAGKSIGQSVILTKIKCSAYGSTVREYKFNYYYDGFYSKLTEVEEYGQNGIRYNATVMDWGDHGAFAKYGTEYYAGLSTNKEGVRPLYADFDGDGRTDFISYPEKSSYSSSDVATLYLTYSNFGGFVQFIKKSTLALNAGFVGLLLVDLNGDGLMDVVRINKIDNIYRYYYFIFNGSLFSASGYFDSASPDAFVGDFDGDGKHEILTKSEKNLHKYGSSTITTTGITTWGTMVHNGRPTRPPARFDSSPRSSGSSAITAGTSRASIFRDVNVADFNGNGKTNLLVITTSGFNIYELNGSSFSLIYSGTDAISSKYLLGDYNGDGKTDILVKNGTQYYILFSTGTGFEKKILPSNLNVTEWFAGDLNRDGKTDIIYTQSNGTGFSLKAGLFDGETFQSENYPTNLMTITNNMDLFTLTDFRGDGFPELCNAKWNDIFVIRTFDSKQNLLVNSISNGLNQKVSFDYKPVTDNTGYYMETSVSYTFPVSKFRQSLYVVTKIRHSVESQSFTTAFFYKNARVHQQGKGFLGFEEIRADYDEQNKKIVTQYGYNTTYFNTYPVKQTVTTISNSPISTTSYTYGNYTSLLNSKVIFPYLNVQTAVDNLTGMTKETKYSYLYSINEASPSLSLVTETQGNLISETKYTWEAKNSPFKNRVTQLVTTRKGGVGSVFTETKKFEYDAKARLTKKIDFFGHAKSVTTNYTNYDNFGNLRTVTTTAANCPTITTSSTLDATGRFVTSNTNALGNISSAKYDAATGVLLEKTDIAGLKVEYQYDGFQRLVQTVSSVDKVTYSTNWNISGNNLFKTTAQSLVSGAQTTWFNGFGQEIKKQTHGFSGQVVSEKEYNIKGQLYRSYLPGYGSKSSQYVEYEYDTYGRILKEINIGRTTSYSYNGLITLVTNPNGTYRNTTVNGNGTVYSSSDEAGNSVYYNSYNSLRKPLTITTAGAVTTITYDDRGFQQSLKDVNLVNSIQYEYNAYGQLISQTNARGQATTFKYDAAGRIIEKICPERTLTYQYVTSGNGIGQIQTIKQNNSVVRSYSYTSLGQVASVTENIDGQPYTISYIYNTYGQMVERQTPSGMKISYQYNNGWLTSMRNEENNTLLWQPNAIDALGKITESTLGNGLIRVSGYDSYHLSNQIQLKNGATVLDQINYSFNATTGNLTSRNDVSNGKNEGFNYDNLNRLTSITPYGLPANSITYHPNGNIKTKFDVGTYEYILNNNHAVDGISNPVPSYTPPVLDITNTSYNRASSLTQQGSIVKKLDFWYNADNQRNKMTYYENNSPKKAMYYIGNYEKEVNTSNGNTKHYDYIYTPEGLTAVAVKDGSAARSLYYVNTDHLGSIRLVTKSDKTIQTRYYYDAWGKQTLTSGTSITNRGYTGHEHLPEFGLINMNARLYDPVLGRFMAADPYVQMPGYTQSFNRYSYCLNNPLKYTDPSGELMATLTTGVVGLVGALVRTIAAGVVYNTNSGGNSGKMLSNAWKDYGNQMSNAWKIDMGLLKTDPNKSDGARVWEFISRFSWQSPQTILGHSAMASANIFYQVKGVSYGYGMTAVDAGIDGAVTIGNFTAGPRGYKADWRDHLFVHEYGHYIQSQQHGPVYLLSVGLPSLQSVVMEKDKNPDSPRHHNRWFEADASYKGAAYFDKHYGSESDGYVAGSEDYFDRNSFVTGWPPSPYTNPRTELQNRSFNPVGGTWHWTDIAVHIPILGFIPAIFY